VHYLGPLLGAALENDTSFNYMHINGPESIFFGYRYGVLDTSPHMGMAFLSLA
jgi:hypothetical protein